MAVRVFALLVTFFALTASASASPGAKHSTAGLVSCDTVAHAATFQGDMQAFGRAIGLELRFALESRPTDGRGWERVAAPTFGQWIAAAPGKTRYVFDKAVESLPVGFSYRAVVRFRWRSASGKIVARAQAATKPCLQPDTRANLKALKVRTLEKNGDGTRLYEVVFANRGKSDAPATQITFSVNDNSQTSQIYPALPAGDRTTLTFVAPRCYLGSFLDLSLDASGIVDEANEADNRLATRCRPGRGR